MIKAGRPPGSKNKNPSKKKGQGKKGKQQPPASQTSDSSLPSMVQLLLNKKSGDDKDSDDDGKKRPPVPPPPTDSVMAAEPIAEPCACCRPHFARIQSWIDKSLVDNHLRDRQISELHTTISRLLTLEDHNIQNREVVKHIERQQVSFNSAWATVQRSLGELEGQVKSCQTNIDNRVVTKFN